METAGTEPQLRELATRVKGDVIVAPFVGLLTVMLAVEAEPAAMLMLMSTWSFVCLPQHFT
jgi:hypothetical protein